MRILVVSGESLVGHEGRNLRLVGELLTRGYEVVHTGPAPEMADNGFTGTTFSHDFATHQDAKEANTRLFKTWSELLDLVDWCDLVLFGVGKGYNQAAEYAAKTDKGVLWHRDVGADHFWAGHCDLVAARGRFEVKHTALRTGLPEGEIQVTGCVQFDEAAPQAMRLDRQAFCRKYELDPDSRIVVIHTPNPSVHTEPTKEITRQACRNIGEVEGFSLLIKPHPREYAGLKIHMYYEDVETPTWEQNAPSVTLLEPYDKYDAYRHSELIVSVHYSALAKETALLGKPLIYLESIERFAAYFSMDPEELRKALPAKLATPASRRPWRTFGTLTPFLKRLPGISESKGWQEMHATWRRCYEDNIPDYIGLDCYVDELAEVLESGIYRYQDAAAFDAYIEEYCLADDGQSYVRVADMVEEAPSYESIGKKIEAQKGLKGMSAKYIRLKRKIHQLLSR